ncbi:MAG: B12-binding domain-containing radical SAM protein [Eubacteriales bacterium]|nr:B12-binding domain-containing radical SAM protein [Eubacteriales bacterium]
MKILLTAINAKFIHSNLAVYSLKSYAQSYLGSKSESETGTTISLAEYTINQQTDDILMDLYKKHPDILCFSCYIWNISHVEAIVREIKKILPQTEIWLGGPEVSYDSEDILRRLPEVKGVMKGEGEETFAMLADGTELTDLAGITYRDSEGMIHANPWRDVMDLDKVPFIYEDMTDFEHKIIYYESSRGCPFSCSYCLSSVDKKLRFRSLDKVKKELQFFIDHKVPQVKFVDRTFNCSHEHAQEIWKYLIEHDNGVTNFHFEVSADLLNAEEIALIRSMRPGLIQLEIGVQSTNPDTVKEIHRTMKFEKVAANVRAVKEQGNVHQHLDLIAGLPYEDMESFRKSFNDVCELRPEQLQLGFLKVLKGSFMNENKDAYGLAYKNTPPYEVLYTKWLSYADVLRLKGVEEMVEVYYNSGQFSKTLPELEKRFEDCFGMYDALASYYEQNGYHLVNHTRAARYEILLSFVKENMPECEQKIRELLTYDYYLRENAKNRPDFAGEYRIDKKELREFYEAEAASQTYLTGYENYDKNQLRRMTHLERFETLGETVLFDYRKRNPLTREAMTMVIEKQ